MCAASSGRELSGCRASTEFSAYAMTMTSFTRRDLLKGLIPAPLAAAPAVAQSLSQTGARAGSPFTSITNAPRDAWIASNEKQVAGVSGTTILWVTDGEISVNHAP